MDGNPTSLTALCALAFVLGAKHGFDADHLAVVDGVARLNSERRPALARAAGALFSLGHGAVVIAVVMAASMLAARSAIPAWLELTGTLISVVFLIVLAALNLHAAFTTPPDQVVRPVGLRAKWLEKAPFLAHPAGVLATGMLFAISFDTVSQAVLFAVVGAQLGGAGAALAAALCFVAGMILVDGVNGLWVARLVQVADRKAVIASRLMAASVGFVSLIVCIFALSKSAIPEVGVWADSHQLWFGAGIVVTLTFVGVVGVLLSRRPRAVQRA